jgi:hypothetical protein
MEDKENNKPYDVYLLIDTNIFFDNYFLRGNKFLALKNMIRKTNSKILMPTIVIDEVKKKYKETLDRQQDRIDEINKKYPDMLTQNKTTKELMAEYDKLWNKQLKGSIVIDSSKVSMKSLIERSLSKRHPFTETGKGFRDALIWESILLFLNNTSRNKNPLVVITDNKTDFGDGCLFDDLQQELLGRNSYCYKDLGTFLNEHESRISFITDELIVDYIELNPQEIEYVASTIEDIDLFERFCENAHANTLISSFHAKQKPSPTGDWILESYYIYREDKNNYYVEIELSVEVAYVIGYARKLAAFDEDGLPDPHYMPEEDVEFEYFSGVISCEIDKKTHEIRPTQTDSNKLL